MSAFTSRATGNWNAGAQTTWNQVGTPALGDSATINNTHVVTITANVTAGDGTATAISVLAGGTITIADMVTFTVYGAIDNAGAINLGAGSGIEFTDVGPSTGGADMYGETYIGTIHGQWIGSHTSMGGL